MPPPFLSSSSNMKEQPPEQNDEKGNFCHFFSKAFFGSEHQKTMKTLQTPLKTWFTKNDKNSLKMALKISPGRWGKTTPKVVSAIAQALSSSFLQLDNRLCPLPPRTKSRHRGHEAKSIGNRTRHCVSKHPRLTTKFGVLKGQTFFAKSHQLILLGNCNGFHPNSH